MKWLLTVALAAALAWSGFWALQAWQTHAAVEDWFDQKREDGWAADYTSLQVRGFPNRVDVTVNDLRLADPDRGLDWQAPAFQVLRLVYEPDHAILAFPPEQRLTVDGQVYDIASDGLRASVSFARSGTLDRAGLEAEVLNIARPNGTTALAGLRGGLAAAAGGGATYQLGLTADAAAGSGSGVGDGLALRADVSFDAPWRRDAPSQPTPQPTQILLDRAEYRAGGVFLRLAGELDVNPDGIPTGEVTVRAENWRAGLDAAVAAGQLPASGADAIGDILGLVAGPSGNPNRLDLRLRFERGQTRLGPVPIGPAPVLQLR